MTQSELKALVKTLRKLGVTQYDDGKGLSLTLTPEPLLRKPRVSKLESKTEKEIKHKVQEFTSLMKMDDVQLLDRLFPDHQQDAESEQ